MSIYCAREFSAHDIQSIGDLIAQVPKLQRSALSRKPQRHGVAAWHFCACKPMDSSRCPPHELVWCAGALTSRRLQPAMPKPPSKQPVHELQRITLQVVSGTAASRLWNEYIARYHYLGYTPMSGSQIRYNVYAGDQLVACISFCACALKLKDRERFIGWSETQRQKTCNSWSTMRASWSCPGSNPKDWRRRSSPLPLASYPTTG